GSLLTNWDQRSLGLGVLSQASPRLAPLGQCIFVLGPRSLWHLAGDTSIILGDEVIAFRHADLLAGRSHGLLWRRHGLRLVRATRSRVAVAHCFSLAASNQNGDAQHGENQKTR